MPAVGSRGVDGAGISLDTVGRYWASTEHSLVNGQRLMFNVDGHDLFGVSVSKAYGNTIRCVR